MSLIVIEIKFSRVTLEHNASRSCHIYYARWYYTVVYSFTLYLLLNDGVQGVNGERNADNENGDDSEQINGNIEDDPTQHSREHDLQSRRKSLTVHEHFLL